MLNATDPATFLSIRELRRLVQESKKPLVFWIGAGASKWLDYPLWKEFAKELRREFFKYVSGFDNIAALKLIETNSFPKFFQMCRDLDQARYYRILSDAFLPRSETILYRRFTEILGKIAPLHILTTNIDEALEQRFPNAGVFQHSDITGCIEQLQSGNSFIAKLHGSRSAIKSSVFTHDDYRSLKLEPGYISTLRHIFALATVIFLGYSVSDQYVVDLLSDNASDMSLFGAGPHFVVSSEFNPTSNLKRIGYSLQHFPDHRSALTVIDVVNQVIARRVELSMKADTEMAPSADSGKTLGSKTAYFISDFMPPGTWETSTTGKLERADGFKSEFTVGLGFTNDEIPYNNSTAAYDLIVGLMSFDFVYFPLSALHRVQVLIGEAAFHHLISSDVIRFVHLQHEPAIVSLSENIIGHVGLVSLTGGAETPSSSIRRQLKPMPGKELEAEKLFSDIEAKVIAFTEAATIGTANLIRASFMMPDVARLLGISEAIVPSQVPIWLRFPCLRMAHLVHTGLVCDRLGIQAAKIPFGGQRLASAAFGVQSASESADQYASYALSGRFNSDVGAALVSQPAILQGVLRFRDTSEGESFRNEIRDQLLTNAASEFSASINAGLARNIPPQILQNARDRLSSLLTEKISLSSVPAVWTNSLQSDDVTRYWRAKSRSLLQDLAKKRGIAGDDPCVCGSGDKFRLCCMSPLRN
jgi:hypothetical protein